MSGRHSYLEIDGDGNEGDSEATNSNRTDGNVQEVVVRIPANALPGQTLQGKTPEGMSFTFKVPSEISGNMIRIRVPRNPEQKHELVQVRIPDNSGEGAQIVAVSPSGARFSCIVPPGFGPGDIFAVQVPPQQPTDQPTDQPMTEAGVLAAAGQQEESVAIKLPDNCQAGSKMKVKLQDGREVSFTVPDNGKPGGVIHILLSHASRGRAPGGAVPGNAAMSLRNSAPTAIEADSTLFNAPGIINPGAPSGAASRHGAPSAPSLSDGDVATVREQVVPNASIAASMSRIDKLVDDLL